MDIKDIRYGLMVIDPSQEGDIKDIIHFVGYFDEPNENDIDLLRKELIECDDFGLTQIAHKLDILHAPDYIVDQIRNNNN